jgi:hypothetical protein
MKSKWTVFFLFVAVAAAIFILGLLVPAHLRAVDASVIERASWNGATILEDGQALVRTRQLSAALMLAQAARIAGTPGWDRLGDAVTNAARSDPAALAWGADPRVEKIFQDNPISGTVNREPFTTFIIRQQNRESVLKYLRASKVAGVQELLHCRELNNTALLPPSSSASGQAFDAAIAGCGQLLDGGYLTGSLSNNISSRATAAIHGGGSEPLEQMLMDFLSLGERLDWSQLTAFVARIEDAVTLRQLADETRNVGDKLPVLFAAVELTGQPAGVAIYLSRFPQTGFADLIEALRSGAGGVTALLQNGERIYNSRVLRALTKDKSFDKFYYAAATFAFHQPRLALALKWLAYLLAGFFIAAALHALWPEPSPLERPLHVRGLHVFQESLFSLGFLFLVLLLTEPFLAQVSQKGEFSLHLRLPTVAAAVPGGIANLKSINVMNPTILLTLLLFFVLQALIYLACLLKLAEIRRQLVPPRMKLKLLENEDLLFDAGLYLGFVGTIVSLILASLGMVKFSLMAAYSSTSFGIIFVSIFKIFHLRPARRQLLMEAEVADVRAAAESAAP